LKIDNFLDGSFYEVWLPQSQTPIKLIKRVGTDEIEVEFDEVVATNPRALVSLWSSFGGQIAIVGTRASTVGVIELNQFTVNYINSVDGDLSKWRIIFQDYAAMNIVLPAPPPSPTDPYPYGYLYFSYVPSP
jgi:hypothetical protein